jgi:hypothetical protein
MIIINMDTSRKGCKNRVRIDYGMKDYYNFYKNKYDNEINYSIFKDIVGEFNKKVAENITDKIIDFTLPFKMGVIGVRKYLPKVKFENNLIINKYPINPIETAKLWEKDPTAKEKKVYVRFLNKHTNGYVFTIHYFKYKAKFKNKVVYMLHPKREVKRRIARNIKEKVIDAFVLELKPNN